MFRRPILLPAALALATSLAAAATAAAAVPEDSYVADPAFGGATPTWGAPGTAPGQFTGATGGIAVNPEGTKLYVADASTPATGEPVGGGVGTASSPTPAPALVPPTPAPAVAAPAPSRGARLTLEVSAPVSIRRGRPATVRFVVRNTGGAAARGVKVCVSTPPHRSARPGAASDTRPSSRGRSAARPCGSTCPTAQPPSRAAARA